MNLELRELKLKCDKEMSNNFHSSFTKNQIIHKTFIDMTNTYLDYNEDYPFEYSFKYLHIFPKGEYYNTVIEDFMKEHDIATAEKYHCFVRKAYRHSYLAPVVKISKKLEETTLKN